MAKRALPVLVLDANKQLSRGHQEDLGHKTGGLHLQKEINNLVTTRYKGIMVAWRTRVSTVTVGCYPGESPHMETRLSSFNQTKCSTEGHSCHLMGLAEKKSQIKAETYNPPSPRANAGGSIVSSFSRCSGQDEIFLGDSQVGPSFCVDNQPPSLPSSQCSVVVRRTRYFPDVSTAVGQKLEPEAVHSHPTKWPSSPWGEFEKKSHSINLQCHVLQRTPFSPNLTSSATENPVFS
ncbi:hypothetical protein STEG23_024235 [Scotinomys teguina]